MVQLGALAVLARSAGPSDTADLRRYYPTSVLVTGFDIIFFWVVRMMFSGQHFMGNVPFKDVYIHALVRDENGEKMSKTKGNVVDPLVAIEKYGVDAFRMTLVAFAAQGRDVLWSEKRVEGYTKFNNKIWQAFRFAMMHMEAYDPAAPRTPGVYDTWILARLGEAVARTRRALDEYKFNDAANEIYQFTWTELCDWYLELSKGTLYDKEPANEPRRQAARHTLRTVFEALVRLFHPIMPFLSEEIWHQLGCKGTVMTAPYPRTRGVPRGRARAGRGRRAPGSGDGHPPGAIRDEHRHEGAADDRDGRHRAVRTPSGSARVARGRAGSQCRSAARRQPRDRGGAREGAVPSARERDRRGGRAGAARQGDRQGEEDARASSTAVSRTRASWRTRRRSSSKRLARNVLSPRRRSATWRRPALRWGERSR